MVHIAFDNDAAFFISRYFFVVLEAISAQSNLAFSVKIILIDFGQTSHAT